MNYNNDHSCPETPETEVEKIIIQETNSRPQHSLQHLNLIKSINVEIGDDPYGEKITFENGIKTSHHYLRETNENSSAELIENICYYKKQENIYKEYVNLVREYYADEDYREKHAFKKTPKGQSDLHKSNINSAAQHFENTCYQRNDEEKDEMTIYCKFLREYYQITLETQQILDRNKMRKSLNSAKKGI